MSYLLVDNLCSPSRIRTQCGYSCEPSSVWNSNDNDIDDTIFNDSAAKVWSKRALEVFTVGDIFFLNMHQLARGTTITTSTSHGIQVEWNFRRRNRRERSSYKDDFSLFGNEPFKNWIELSTTERGGHVTKSLWMEFILLEWWVLDTLLICKSCGFVNRSTY